MLHIASYTADSTASDWHQFDLIDLQSAGHNTLHYKLSDRLVPLKHSAANSASEHEIEMYLTLTQK